MLQDNLLAYDKGRSDIRTCKARIRQIDAELATAARVASLPPRTAVEVACAEISSGPEPATYERRRSILEGILDLRMKHYDGDLEIEGKIPIPATASAVAEKNRYWRLGADAERQRKHCGRR